MSLSRPRQPLRPSSDDRSVRVVCRPELAPGFELAGLTVDRAGDGAAAAVVLRRLGADPQVGVVLVEERLHRAVPSEVLQRLDRRVLPVITPFPSPGWDVQGLAEEYVLEILRQAIGYRVRPR
jgi:vacuolar-type H+-ATPase subunit F/Vma7